MNKATSCAAYPPKNGMRRSFTSFSLPSGANLMTLIYANPTSGDKLRVRHKHDARSHLSEDENLMLTNMGRKTLCPYGKCAFCTQAAGFKNIRSAFAWLRKNLEGVMRCPSPSAR
jgi:hypothetical protein